MFRFKLMRCLLLFVVGIHSCGEASDKVPPKLVSAWKARADAIDHLKTTWRVKIKHDALPGDTVSANEQFVFDRVNAENHRWRLSIMSILAEPGEDVLQDQAVITNSGGDRNITFYAEGRSGYPVASVSDQGKAMLRHLQLIPIRLVYFPLDAGHGVFSSEEIEEAVEARYDETDCLLLKAGPKQVWVKNTPPYLPLRYAEVHDGAGKVRYDFRLNYAAKTQESFPQLTSWSFVHFSADGKKIAERRDVSVTSLKANQQPDDEMFAQEFPHGTWVNDCVAGRSFVFRVGQSNPSISRIVDYEDVLNSDDSSEKK